MTALPALRRPLRFVFIASVLLLHSAVAAQQPASAPESFTAATSARDRAGVPGTVLARVDKYTPEPDRARMTAALKYGGHTAFMDALRKAPAVGYVTLAGRRLTVRWARQESAGTGRHITLVTDGVTDGVTDTTAGGRGTAGTATPRGDEVTIIELNVDRTGVGTGTMVAAARLKPNEVVGASIEDERAERIALTAVTRITP